VRDIYTPEFVFNGEEWGNWFGAKNIPSPSGTNAGILKVTSDDAHHWQVGFIPAADEAAGYEVTPRFWILN
jgi:hypothetical protein